MVFGLAEEILVEESKEDIGGYSTPKDRYESLFTVNMVG
jgi:hypothetical protein